MGVVDDADLFVDYAAPLSTRDLERLLDRVDAALSVDEVPEQEVLRLWMGTATASRPVQNAVGPLYGLLDDWHERAAPEVALRGQMAVAARRARTVLGKERRHSGERRPDQR